MGLKHSFVAFSTLSLASLVLGCDGGPEDLDQLPGFGKDPSAGSTQEQKTTTPTPAANTPKPAPVQQQLPDAGAKPQSTAASCPSGYPSLLQTFTHLKDITKAGKCDATCVTTTHCCFEPDLSGLGGARRDEAA